MRVYATEESKNSTFILTHEEGFKKAIFVLDDNNKVSEINLLPLKYSFFFEAKIVMTELKQITTFEDEQLNLLLGIPFPENIGTKLAKFSQENFFEIGDKINSFFFNGQLILSNVSTKNRSLNYIESYGIGMRRKFTTPFSEQRFVVLFLGTEIKNINNFTEFDAEEKLEKSTELTLYLSATPKTKDFFDFRFGTKLDSRHSKENSTAFLKIHSILNMENFNIILSGEANLRLKNLYHKIDSTVLQRYGSYEINVGFANEINQKMGYTIIFLIEKNKRFGYQKEAFSCSIYWKF